jgi:hypothetical protein
LELDGEVFVFFDDFEVLIDGTPQSARLEFSLFGSTLRTWVIDTKTL